MRIDRTRLEVNWPLYGYLLFVVISTLFNFLSIFRFSKGEVTYGYAILTNYSVLVIYAIYWIKVMGYTKFRDANPLITTLFNKGVFLVLYLMVFNSMSINWKNFFISMLLELSVGFFYIVDVAITEYVEEDITEDSEVV